MVAETLAPFKGSYLALTYFPELLISPPTHTTYFNISGLRENQQEGEVPLKKHAQYDASYMWKMRRDAYCYSNIN